MKLRELKNALAGGGKKPVRFLLPDGNPIPLHAHVTEVGRVGKNFVDCGGLAGELETCLLQTWVGEDTDHQLTSERLADILQLANRVVPDDGLEVEVEYDCCVVGQYAIAQVKIAADYLDIALANKRTQCLARERRKVESASTCCEAATVCC